MGNVRWDSSEAKRIARKAGMKAVLESAEAILTESIDETPKDTGTLRRSGTVTEVVIEPKAVISYSTPYAARQHEELDYRHEVGKAKYLEDPVNRNRDHVRRHVQKEVKKALQNAKGGI